MAAHSPSARTIAERLAALVTAVAAGIVVIALAILPFLSPAGVGFEQGRSGAGTLTGFSEPELAVVDLVAALTAVVAGRRAGAAQREAAGQPGSAARAARRLPSAG